MTKFFHYVLARVEEQSTWSGTGVVSLALTIAHLSPDLTSRLLLLGAAFGGVMKIVLPEAVEKGAK